MGMTEILPHIRSLEHADKLRLMQMLLTEIAKDEGVTLANKDEKDYLDSLQPDNPSEFGKHMRYLRDKALQSGHTHSDWESLEAEVRLRRIG